MDDRLDAAWKWATGVFLALDMPTLPLVLVLNWKVTGVRPGDVAGITGAWEFISLLIISLGCAFAVAGKPKTVEWLRRTGWFMITRGNIFAWIVWLLIGGAIGCAVLLVFALLFKEAYASAK